MRKPLPHFCGEHEISVRRNSLDPGLRVVRANRTVETCVDLDGVKKFRQVSGFVKPLGLLRRIRIPQPIRIRPSRWPHSNVCSRVLARRQRFFCHCAINLFRLRFRFRISRRLCAWPACCQPNRSPRFICTLHRYTLSRLLPGNGNCPPHSRLLCSTRCGIPMQPAFTLQATAEWSDTWDSLCGSCRSRIYRCAYETLGQFQRFGQSQICR